MKKHPNIESLMRSQLEGAEFSPSRVSWESVQRKLRWQKFLRFRPGSFNVYYLSTLILGTTFTGTILMADNVQTYSIDPAERMSQGTRDEGDAGESARVDGALSRGKSSNRGEYDAQEFAEEAYVRQVVGEIRKKKAALVAADWDQEAAGLEEKFRGGNAAVDDSAGESAPMNAPVAYFTPSVREGCVPLTVIFENTSLRAESWHWEFGDLKEADRNEPAGTSEEKHPAFTFTSPGVYKVKLRVQGMANQTAARLEEIVVYPVPEAEFRIETREHGAGETSLDLVNYSSGAMSYSWTLEEGKGRADWSSGEFQPKLALSEVSGNSPRMKLIATDERGCSDTATLSLEAAASELRSLRFPTAFSPNTSGPTGGHYSPHEKRSDVFHPVFSIAPDEFHLRIFNKTGEQIFETRDIYVGWDGYYHQKQAAAGVYLWVLSGKWENGENFSQRGDLTLLWDSRWP